MGRAAGRVNDFIDGLKEAENLMHARQIKDVRFGT
jgi:hypothetical protein